MSEKLFSASRVIGIGKHLIDAPLSRVPVFARRKDIDPVIFPIAREDAIVARQRLQDPDVSEVVIETPQLDGLQGGMLTHERTTARVVNEETFAVRLRSEFATDLQNPTYNEWYQQLSRLQQHVGIKGMLADLRIGKHRKALDLTVYRGQDEHAILVSAYPHDQHLVTELVLKNAWDEIMYPTYKGNAPRFVRDAVRYGSVIGALSQFK